MNKRQEMIRVIREEYGLDSPRVFSAMLRVPREKFAPKLYRLSSYSDGPTSIGYGQTMSQPYTVAFMTHLLISAKNSPSQTSGSENLTVRRRLSRAGGKEQRTKGTVGNKFKNWRVLEVGTGSGYQAAILSLLAKEVYSIEIINDLAIKAQERLKKLGYKNVYVKAGSGEWGWPEKAPFDAIIITAALERNIPEKLVDQLKVGGIIVAPVGPHWLQTMTRFIKKDGGSLKKEEFQKYVFVPFVEEKN